MLTTELLAAALTGAGTVGAVNEGRSRWAVNRCGLQRLFVTALSR